MKYWIIKDIICDRGGNFSSQTSIMNGIVLDDWHRFRCIALWHCSCRLINNEYNQTGILHDIRVTSVKYKKDLFGF